MTARLPPTPALLPRLVLLGTVEVLWAGSLETEAQPGLPWRVHVGSHPGEGCGTDAVSEEGGAVGGQPCLQLLPAGMHQPVPRTCEPSATTAALGSWGGRSHPRAGEPWLGRAAKVRAVMPSAALAAWEAPASRPQIFL